MHVQAALWSAGNALTSGTPIYFLSMELGAKNTEVGVLLALPTLLGVFRLLAPWVIYRTGGDVKRACLGMMSASYLVAMAIPAVAYYAKSPGFEYPLLALIALLCIHQTLEYLGLVALYAWLGELVPARIRGAYFGARQFWQLAIEIPVILLSGIFIDRWGAAFHEQKLTGYALTLGVGVLCLLASLVALLRLAKPLRHVTNRLPAKGYWAWREILTPFTDRRFRRLLYYGCWFSTFNGLTASPQQTYPRGILNLGVFDMNLMRTGMRLGQFALSRPLGMLCDRIGHRPVLVVSQLFVAAGPLFFLIATPAHPYWIAGAFLLWSWYVGLNVGLPSLMLKLAPRGASSPYVAAYFGVTGTCYAAASIIGGYALDRLIAHYGLEPLVGSWNIYQLTFLFAWATRTFGVVWLSLVNEPGVKRFLNWRS